MQRIKYAYNVESKLFESVPVFTGLGHVKAGYNNVTLEYLLTNNDNGSIVKQDKAKNKQQMLRMIRKEFINLGAVLYSEVRTKKVKLGETNE